MQRILGKLRGESQLARRTTRRLQEGGSKLTLGSQLGEHKRGGQLTLQEQFGLYNGESKEANSLSTREGKLFRRAPRGGTILIP